MCRITGSRVPWSKVSMYRVLGSIILGSEMLGRMISRLRYRDLGC